MKDQIVDATRQVGLLEGAKTERERTEALAREEAAIETEVLRRLALSKVEETITSTNGPVASHVSGTHIAKVAKVAANVETIKKGVEAVQDDVTDIKAEVTKEVRDGVAQGISDAHEEIEHRADRELKK